MDDLKSVTVEYLRELARKHLGKGHSKLKTKAQLLAALAVAMPALAMVAKRVKSRGKKAAEASKAAASGKSGADGRESAVTDEKKAAEPQGKKGARKGAARGPEPTVKPALVVNFPPKARRVTPPEPEPIAAPASTEVPAAPVVQHDAEPLVEGFFVARVRGEDEARLHHLTSQGHPSDGGGFEENLGELPLDYGDDTALALPRDPHSLYVTWDFNAATRRQAQDTLEAPRAVLRVFDGETLVREVDFALESRSFYIHGLPAGRPYRVEAHFVGRDGRSRRIGQATNRVQLPWVGPSPDTSVRFMRMPARIPAAGGAPAGPIRAVAFEEREYITWRRVPLPGSGGFEDVPDVRRERTPTEGPGAPLELTPRPPGASEQRYLEASREEGSSEQTTWTPPPSGRGRQ